MIDILSGEFFWGIVVGLILSLIGGYALARFTVSMQRKYQRENLIRLCLDTIKNIRAIADEFDEVRNRASAIHEDYLTLIDVELNVFGRNREYLVMLPENAAEAVRRFMNDIALRRTDTSLHLQEFYRISNLSEQIRAQGRGPEAERTKEAAIQPLGKANTSADRLVQTARHSDGLLTTLKQLD
ncbi:hypothetical protein J7348_12850 [Qipengyuania flava]|uniref:hypothetical protein n=1 Tax=Qipengyuania flava TaxID=192812 RepID=UPI001ADB0503|nr:hypothetical protein [Qipengyuania flava]MBO9505512.1 hypothetical protein [Qipengyuania flava]